MAQPVPIAFAAVKRSGFPESVLLNALSEASPTKPATPESIIARPGLEDFATVGTAPNRGIFQRQGLLSDAAVIVSTSGVHTLTASGVVTTQTGTVSGTGLVDIDGGLDADSETVIRFAVQGGALHKLFGGVVSQEDFPVSGGAGATSVQFYKGYWLATEYGTDALYYQEPAATTWGALEFASAEYAPDKLKGVRVFGDLFALLGENSTEIWYATGNSTSPLEPFGGLRFDFGCRSIFAAVNCQGVLIWPDHNGSVRMCAGGDAQLISDNGLAEQIRRTAAGDLVAGFYVKDQHPCYVLRLGSEATWVYDLSTKRWSRFSSLGYDFWRPWLFCNIGDVALAQDSLSNAVYRIDPDMRTDGSDVFTVTFQALVEVPVGTMALANLQLDCEVGDAPRSGQGSDPKIVLRISRDRKTWGPPKERSLGATGKYTVQPRWDGLGDLKAPGGILEFSVSDPVGRRFSAAFANCP